MRGIRWSAAAVAIAAVVLLAPGPADASCVGERELADGSVANFVGHVEELGHNALRAVVVVDSVAAGRVRRGERIEVVDDGSGTSAATGLLLGARYRFRPQSSLRQPLRVNGCIASRLPGFVLPRAAVRVVERRPGWLVPALVGAFGLGVAAGLLARRRFPVDSGAPTA